ncbi:hypothetical protein D3C71_1746390 [compost metagenome]
MLVHVLKLHYSGADARPEHILNCQKPGRALIRFNKNNGLPLSLKPPGHVHDVWTEALSGALQQLHSADPAASASNSAANTES